MKQLHHIIYVSLLAALLASCEKELPYTVGSQEPLLVMNALLDANEEENLVHLCLSETHSTRPVSQATVTLYINGKQAGKDECFPAVQNIKTASQIFNQYLSDAVLCIYRHK